jgi:hypothetical protein
MRGAGVAIPRIGADQKDRNGHARAPAPEESHESDAFSSAGPELLARKQ